MSQNPVTNNYANPVLEEISQAKARLVYAIIVFFYFIYLPNLSHGAINSLIQTKLLIIDLAVLCYATAQLVFLKPENTFSPIRQITNIHVDMFAMTFCLYLGGEWVAVAYPLFLWIIVGNGIRFGLFYLIVAMLLGLLGFAIVLYGNSYWQQHRLVGTGLLLSVLVLPAFFSFLINRLHGTKRQLLEELERTSYLASHDFLTELPNRASFNQRLHTELQRAQRNQEYFAVFFMDVDDFKRINDTHGHDVGDKLLIEIAQRIKKSVRDIDHVSRIGGDEFACITASGPSIEKIQHLKQRLADKVNHPLQLTDLNVNISVSIGEAFYPQDGKDFETLLVHSDEQMYKQKLHHQPFSI